MWYQITSLINRLSMFNIEIEGTRGMKQEVCVMAVVYALGYLL
jgi:hypothetical protein